MLGLFDVFDVYGTPKQVRRTRIQRLGVLLGIALILALFIVTVFTLW